MNPSGFIILRNLEDTVPMGREEVAKAIQHSGQCSECSVMPSLLWLMNRGYAEVVDANGEQIGSEDILKPECEHADFFVQITTLGIEKRNTLPREGAKPMRMPSMK